MFKVSHLFVMSRCKTNMHAFSMLTAEITRRGITTKIFYKKGATEAEKKEVIEMAENVCTALYAGEVVIGPMHGADVKLGRPTSRLVKKLVKKEPEPEVIDLVENDIKNEERKVKPKGVKKEERKVKPEGVKKEERKVKPEGVKKEERKVKPERVKNEETKVKPEGRKKEEGKKVKTRVKKEEDKVKSDAVDEEKQPFNRFNLRRATLKRGNNYPLTLKELIPLPEKEMIPTKKKVGIKKSNTPLMTAPESLKVIKENHVKKTEKRKKKAEKERVAKAAIKNMQLRKRPYKDHPRL